MPSDMAPHHAISSVLLSLLTLSAAAPPQPSTASPIDQLKSVLTPVVQRAVSSSGSSWQLQQLAAQLARQQLRLDAVARDVSALQLEMLVNRRSDLCHLNRTELHTISEPTEQEPRAFQPEPQIAEPTEPEPETACEDSPSPLASDAAPYRRPALSACARSCLQLRNRLRDRQSQGSGSQEGGNQEGGSPQDGVYWFRGMPVPVLCDFSHDQGGWTLLLTAVSHPGWDALSVLNRNPNSPSLTDNYAILQHADFIRDLGTGSRFAYRIETQAEKGRQRWGGVWFAPRSYSFTDETGSQTDVSRVRFFNKWGYKQNGVKQRMPWINTGLHGTSPVLTTLTPGGDNWWGTLVSHETETTYHHSPWMHPEAQASGTVLYWMREEAV